MKEGRLPEGSACGCTAPYASWWWSSITIKMHKINKPRGKPALGNTEDG